MTPTPSPAAGCHATPGAPPASVAGPAQAPTEDPAQELARLRAQLAERDQRLADMAAAHEEFLRAVSHDLRAPLRHITSYGPLVTEVLQEADGALPTGQALQEALEFLATMEQSARRMGRMLDALLALSRVARAPLHPQQLSRAEVADLIAQVQDALAPRAAGRAVQWQLTLAKRPVYADAALLRQLLTELLDNALKFTRGREPAHIAITLAVESPGASDATGAGDARTQGDPASAGSPGAPDSQGSAGGQVTLHVQDNGAGFAPAQSAGLFGVFQRLHRESEFDGVGAGLAVVRAIAQRHGGQVSATATPGQGCTVCVTWPAKCSLFDSCLRPVGGPQGLF